MHGSPLPLRTWKRALFIWTGGNLPSSSEELARRLGVNEGTAQDITYRILKAAEEDIPPLWEPAEMAHFKLSGDPRFKHAAKADEGPSVFVIALKGRRSGRTIIERIPKIAGRRVQDFAIQNLAPGQTLYLSDNSVHQGIRSVKRRILPRREASYLLQDLRERIFTANFMVHNGVGENHVGQYLTGYQWWENHHHLTHRERMCLLARGMMWKEPPPSRTQRKRDKRKAEPPVDGPAEP